MQGKYSDLIWKNVAKEEWESNSKILDKGINFRFGCADFLRIIDWMPYIIELDFEGNKLIVKHEYCHVEKEFKGNQCADKR